MGEKGALDLDDLVDVADGAWRRLDYVGTDVKVQVKLSAVDDYRHVLWYESSTRRATGEGGAAWRTRRPRIGTCIISLVLARSAGKTRRMRCPEGVLLEGKALRMVGSVGVRPLSLADEGCQGYGEMHTASLSARTHPRTSL